MEDEEKVQEVESSHVSDGTPNLNNSTNLKHTKNLHLFFLVFTSLLLSILVGTLVYMGYNGYIMYKRIGSLSNELSSSIEQQSIVTKKIEILESDLKAAKSYGKTILDMKEQISLYDARINELYVYSNRYRTTSAIPLSCVTDSFTVSTSVFNGFGDIFVDLDIQPVYAAKYEGQGKFSVEDRELKGELLDTYNLIISLYSKIYSGDMLAPNKIKVMFSVKGYDVGSVVGETVTLKGE